VTAPKLDPPSVTFSYSNLSGRPSSHVLNLLARILPGVRKVENEIAPYAAAWHEHNLAALASTDPLWVVLGDSLSQGVGASSIGHSWVLQAQRRLAAVGPNFRIINLSVSGATVPDVLDRQIPALNGLAAVPAMVTVLIGSNDVIHHNLRVALLDHYRTLVAAVPPNTFVLLPDRANGVFGEIAQVVADNGRTATVHAISVHLSGRLRAEDHFHFNDNGYAQVANDFVTAVLGLTAEPTRGLPET
jgi:lysophospholipase L1-like esterase